MIPVINENDTVVTDEIKFGDNDTLGALVTNLIEADALVILTDQAGLYDADPRTQPGREAGAGSRCLRSRARCDGRRHRQRAREGRHAHQGPGGAARREQRRAYGDRLGREPDVLVRLSQGERIGTLAHGEDSAARRAQAMARRSSHRSGALKLDAGAAQALQRDGKSLLPIGVLEVTGEFERGEVVACLDPDGREVARGLVNYSAAETRRILRRPSSGDRVDPRLHG